MCPPPTFRRPLTACASRWKADAVTLACQAIHEARILSSLGAVPPVIDGVRSHLVYGEDTSWPPLPWGLGGVPFLERMAERIDAESVVRIKRAGHNLPQEQPGYLAREVLRVVNFGDGGGYGR